MLTYNLQCQASVQISGIIRDGVLLQWLITQHYSSLAWVGPFASISKENNLYPLNKKTPQLWGFFYCRINSLAVRRKVWGQEFYCFHSHVAFPTPLLLVLQRQKV